MRKDVKILLCLYGLYADGTECKLALLKGTRAYSDFRDHVFPFISNMFAEPPADIEEIKRLFLGYMLQVQSNYYNALVRYGLTTPHAFHDMTCEDVSVERIKDNHRTLCEMDGAQVLVYGINSERLDLEWQLPQHLVRALVQGIGHCLGAYRQLNRFCLLCENKSVSPFHSLNQSMTEIREFLTHFCRGYLFFLTGNAEKAERDFEAGLQHLKRATLDMRKSILTTIFKKTKKRFPKSLFGPIMSARQNELFLGPNEDGKIKMYEREVDMLLSRTDWFD